MDILFLLLLTTIVTWADAGGFPKNFEPKNFECVPYSQVLRNVIVESSVTHFATTKLPFASRINPNDIEPLTIENLFQNYYGENVCTQRFQSAYQEILYSDPGTESPENDKDSVNIEHDKIKLRALVRQLVTVEDYETARIKFGALIVRSLTDLLDESWKDSRCVARYELSNAESIIWNEIYKLMSSVTWRQYTEMFGLSVGSRLSIAIDETGTMSREISAANERSRVIMDEERGSVFQLNYFVLVPFNDPTVGPVTATHLAGNYTDAFNQVFAHGGGDPPELTMRGISLALEKMQPLSQLFVFTDAESKDVLLQDYVIALAKLKQIRISFVITSRIWSILCFGSSRAENAQACSDRTLKFGNDLYAHIARETGGRLMLVPRTNLAEGSKIMDTITKDTYPLIDVARFARGAVSMDVNVDSSVSKLYIESNSGCQNLGVLFDGSKIEFESQTTNQQALDSIVSVEEPGNYTITATANQECIISVRGVSTKGLLSTFAQNVENENGDVFLKKVEGTPLGDASMTVLLDAFGLEDGDSVTDVEVIDVDTGRSVQIISLTEPSSGRYRFQVNPQVGKTLRLRAAGKDFDGFQFQRTVSQTFTFNTFDFDCSEMDQEFARPGGVTRYEIGVKNFGARTASLRISVNDNQDYIKSFGQTKLVVPRGQTKNIVVALEVPEDAVPGTVVTIILTGQAITSSSTMFYKKYQVTIREPIPFECESYKVVSDVTLRFATTVITNSFVNRDSITRNYNFQVPLPTGAYVTAFTARVNDVEHFGVITEVEASQPMDSDGSVDSKDRDRDFSISSEADSSKPSMKVFQTSVPVEADGRVTFVLTYQQVITKISGRYRHQISMNSGPTVTKDFSVIINICEVGEVAKIVRYGISTELDARPKLLILPGLTSSTGGNSAMVKYEPTRAEQIRLSPAGVRGNLLVEYAITTSDPNGNAVGYTTSFVQFLHPQLQVMQRRVVFVIDASAFMFGDKMTSTRKAMEMIISRFNPTDMFTIVAVNSNTNTWSPDLNKANSANSISANLFLQNVQARGELNLAKGINHGLKILADYAKDQSITMNPATDYLLVITGGKSSDNIMTEVASRRNVGINTCGLSDSVDFDELEILSKKNNGQSILISNTANAAEMTSMFSENLENAALVDVQVSYDNSEILSVSSEMFSKYSLGSEILIAGTTSSVLSALNYAISGRGDSGVTTESGSMPVVPADELCTSIQEGAISRMSSFVVMIELLKSNDIFKRVAAKKIAVDNGFVVPGLTKIQLETAHDVEITSFPVIEEPQLSENLTETNVTVDDTETTEAPVTTTTIDFSSVSFATPGINLPTTTKPPNNTQDKLKEAKMQVFGDPHFVVDISPQIRLCFNWDAPSGEMFNLLNDPISGISVNARLSSISAPKDSLRNKRTYVNRLGFIFNRQNTTVLINPYVARINFGKKGSAVVRFSDSKVLRGRGLRFVMQYINSYSSSFTIYVGRDVSFRVITRVKSSSSHIRDHLDYSVLKKDGISRWAKGIMGELNSVTFRKSPATLDIQPDGQSAMLWYRNKVVPVTHHIIVDYNAKTEVECWYLANKGLLWTNEDKKFGVDSILKSEKIRSFKKKPK